MSNLLKSSAVMAAGTAVSRVLGFARALILVAALGQTYASANTFDTANKIPNILYMLLAGGVLNAVLVPQIVRAGKREDGGADYVNRLVTLSLLLLFGATILLTVGAPLLVLLYASQESRDWLMLGTAFAYWCIPQVFFYGLYTVLGQILNANGRFAGYMWAPVVNNIVSIAGIGVFLWVYGPGNEGQHTIGSWTPAMIALVAGTSTLGVACQALILLWPLRRIGFRYRPTFGFRGVGLRSASRVAMWTFAAAVVGQLGLVVTSNVANQASALNRGTSLESSTAGIATYSMAQLLFMLPHSLVAVSLVTALFTKMSSSAGSGDWPAVRGDLSLGLRIVGMFNLLATAGLLVIALPLGLAINNGDRGQGTALALVVATMALGLTFFSANYLLQRVYYAHEDARTPFLIQLPAVGVIVTVNLLSLWLLPAQYVVAGIGAGLSLSYLVSALSAGWLLRRRHGSLDGRRILRTHVRLLLAAVVSGAVGGLAVWATRPWLEQGVAGSLLVCLVAGVAVVVVYLACLRLLQVDELNWLLRGPLGRLRRR